MTIIRMPKPKYLDCDECINGHAPECDDLRPEDLYDCLWKLCTGCCPNGCPERGLELLASREGAKLRAMLQTDTEMAQHVNDDVSSDANT